MKKGAKLWMSLDLSAIELIWSEMHRIHRREYFDWEWAFSDVEECLGKTAVFIFEKPLERMGRLFKAIIKADGCFI